ncbi:MAG: hypothetical protein ACOC56_00380 [Atribacterota bacterium]
MDFLKFNVNDKKKEKKFSPIGFKSPQKVVKVSSHQTGKTNKKRDKARDALPPGKRISKSGNEYWETRANRSDLRGKKV